MGFVKIFWKNNMQDAYLPKISILGQNVSEIYWPSYKMHQMMTPYKSF